MFTQLQVSKLRALNKTLAQDKFCKLGRERPRKYQYVTQSRGTWAFVSTSASSCKLRMELRVQYLLLQMRCEPQFCNICLLCNLCKWGMERSKILIWYATWLQMTSNLYRWGVKLSTILICYATRVKLVQMKSELQYNTHLICNLCKWHPTCTDEE